MSDETGKVVGYVTIWDDDHDPTEACLGSIEIHTKATDPDYLWVIGEGLSTFRGVAKVVMIRSARPETAPEGEGGDVV